MKSCLLTLCCHTVEVVDADSAAIRFSSYYYYVKIFNYGLVYKPQKASAADFFGHYTHWFQMSVHSPV